MKEASRNLVRNHDPARNWGHLRITLAILKCIGDYKWLDLICLWPYNALRNDRASLFICKRLNIDAVLWDAQCLMKTFGQNPSLNHSAEFPSQKLLTFVQQHNSYSLSNWYFNKYLFISTSNSHPVHSYGEKGVINIQERKKREAGGGATVRMR